MQIGDTIKFAEYEWIILEIQNDNVLLITKDVLEKRAYHVSNKDTTWAECEMRAYLNSEFYDTFMMEDKLKIVQVYNTNLSNQWYDARGGEDTYDYIFLLSIEEVVCKYFGDSSQILKNPGFRKYKYWFDKKDENNIKRLANGSWWLRSPGRNNKTAAYIHGLASNQLETSGGCVGINGNSISSKGGVRPALWIKK